MLATHYTHFLEWYLALVTIASLPGIASAVWCHLKRKRSILLFFISLVSVILGLSLVRGMYANDPETWFFRITLCLPLASGALGVFCSTRRYDSVA